MMSANTGVAPTATVILAAATKLMAGWMTSSPGPSSSASNARWSAAVPLATAIACLLPTCAANSRSNAATSGPIDSHPPRRTRSTAASSSGPYSRSLRGIRHSDMLEHLLLLGEEFLRLRVVVRAPDVEPEAVRRKRAHTLAAVQQSQNEVREVEILALLDVGQDAVFVDVDPHADVVRRDRLLLVTGNPMLGIEVQHAEVDLDRPAVSGDRQHRPLGAVEGDQGIEIQIGKQVAIHDQERLVQSLDRGERPGRPGRGFFLHVPQIDLVQQSSPLVEVGAHQFAQVAEGQADVADAEANEAADEDFKYRLVAQGHQRLGKADGERVQARPLAAGQDHGFQP